MSEYPSAALASAASRDCAADAEARDAARAARLRLMQVLEPQDTTGTLLVTGLGPRRAAEVVIDGSAVTAEEFEDLTRGHQTARDLLQGPSWQRSRERWSARADHRVSPRLLEHMERRGFWLAVPEDPDWPESLTEVGPAQPLGLWGAGDRARLGFETCTAVAFVGCRDATSYGTAVTSHFAGDLAAAGFSVLSGGAFGIDAAAHRAALATAAGTPSTVAFLACGIDRCYPRAHESLLREIAESGLVLSEVPPGTSPMRHRFLQRNRLIAAMSAATVVVEAGHRSGALNTAHHAVEFGKDVYAVPGSVFSAQSAGCHRLLAEGSAAPLTDVSALGDRLLAAQQELFPADAAVQTVSSAAGGTRDGQGSRSAAEARSDLSEAQCLVLDALPVRRGASPDRICTAAGLGIREVLPVLAQLEARGLARRSDAGWRTVPRPEHPEGSADSEESRDGFARHG